MFARRGLGTPASTPSLAGAVLVVEPDNALSREVSQHLSISGLTASIANSVESAIEAVSQTAFSYAITELKFDMGSGFDVLNALSAHQPNCRTVVFTSHCTPGIALRAVQAGAEDVIPKPTDVDFLIGILLGRDMLHTPGASPLPTPNSIRDEHIREVFLSSGSNVARAANRLSMHRRTLQRIMKRLPDLRAKG